MFTYEVPIATAISDQRNRFIYIRTYDTSEEAQRTFPLMFCQAAPGVPIVDVYKEDQSIAATGSAINIEALTS